MYIKTSNDPANIIQILPEKSRATFDVFERFLSRF